MKSDGISERRKMDQKLLKPQVEKRRRERMNRSLENLRALLLQGPEHNSPSQKRAEKAEVLECTVLFLQNSLAEAARLKKEAGRDKSPFIDGFTTCLQEAARFLAREGDTRGLERSVSSTLCHHLSRSCLSVSIRLPVRVQLPDHQQTRGRSTTDAASPSNSFPLVRDTDSSTRACQKHPNATRSTSHHQLTADHTVWRPWP